MTRRYVVVALGLGLIVLPRQLYSVQGEKVWRIGFVAGIRRPESLDADVFGEVQRGLRDLGYIEGKNLVIEWRFADGRYERLSGLAEELVRLKVDVIVTDGTPSTIAAQKATRTIPIVFINAGDPVGNNLIESLARPGGNTTGVAMLLTETSAKQVELLQAVVPRLSRLAVLSNSDNPYSPRAVAGLEAAARGLKVSVLSLGARTEQDIESAFGVMTEKGVEAFVWVRDVFFNQQRGQIAALAARHRLPGMGGIAEYAEVGGLMSYGVSRAGNYRRAATYVEKILKGANPGTLPVEQPMKLDLVINRKTAKALGLTIPPELLLFADKVIE